MTAEEFDRNLRLERCWVDGCPTTRSSAGQRQCVQCRRKWSFLHLRRRWRIAQGFAQGLTRREAAVAADADVHTAGRFYREVQARLGPFFVEQLRRSDGAFAADPQRIAEACARVLRTPDQAKRLRLVVQLGLAELSPEGRLELIYRLVFRARIQALTRSAIAASLRRRSTGGPQPGARPAAPRRTGRV